MQGVYNALALLIHLKKGETFPLEWGLEAMQQQGVMK